MSHFIVAVLLTDNKGKITPQNAEEKVGEVLAPYQEELEVPEYDKECYCIGNTASKDVGERADKKFGPIEDYRAKFKEIFKGKPDDWFFSEESDEEWGKLMKPRGDWIQAELEKHPDFKKPDPKCSECKGSGTYKSTYNPKSKWDWFSIGGRWDGTFNGKNIVPVSELDPNDPPFAIVTPDGEWHEKGHMGWWAIVSDKKDKEKWQAEYKEIISRYGKEGCWAVAVDCHI